MSRPTPAPIPVTVIGGYLGSGKTTLLNHLLTRAVGRRITVLVNDFGEIGIDGDLIESVDGDTITLTNGCVCCAIGSDLMTALWSIRDRADPPDHVIIEASGIADPAPIAHHALTPGFDLDGIVVLLDAETVRRRERHPVVGRTIRRQLAAADVLVLNKTDLVSPEQLAELDSWLARAAPRAPVLHARDGMVPLAALVGFAHDGDVPPAESLEHEHDYATIAIRSDGPLDRAHLERFLDALPPGVLRVKGIVQLDESPDRRSVVHRVAGRRSITTNGPWREGESGRIVIIATADTELGGLVQRLFPSCPATKHVSVVVSTSAPVTVHLVSNASVLIAPSPVDPGRSPGPRYSLLLTSDHGLIRAAQELRYQVFSTEPGFAFDNDAAVDADEFDEHCDHILVRDDHSGEVIGCYRMLPPAGAIAAGGLYSATEFDISALDPLRPSMVEMGRAVVRADHRNGAVILMMWTGILAYLDRCGYDHLIGCISVPTHGEHPPGVELRGIRDLVLSRYAAPAEFTVHPYRPVVLDGRGLDHIQPPDRTTLPALMRGYLRLGARICGQPAHDPEFGVGDFPALLDKRRADRRYLTRLRSAAAAGGPVRESDR